MAPADFFDWRRDAGAFAFMAAYEDAAVNLTCAGEPERLKMLLATPGFLDVLGIPPAQGRDSAPTSVARAALRRRVRAAHRCANVATLLLKETVGRHRVVLLSDTLRRHRFGPDPHVVGLRTLRTALIGDMRTGERLCVACRRYSRCGR